MAAVIHIVDDDKSFRTSIGRLLEASGFTVFGYSSASELLAGLRVDEPGCILLDLRMPGLNGLELQKRLLGVLDKFSGAALVLIGLGIVPFALTDFGALSTPLERVITAAPFAAVIAGFFLWRQGNRLMRLDPGARESQLFWSALLLPFPPIFTGIGIYGLATMTSHKARIAFDLGRKALHPSGATTVIRERVVNVSREKHPRKARFLIRAAHFLAVIWSLYAAFVGLEMLALDIHDIRAEPMAISLAIDNAEFVRDATVIAAGIAFLMVLHTFVTRHERRGFGLAVLAFLFLTSASGLLLMGVESARDLFDVTVTSSWMEALPRALAFAPTTPTPPLLENLT